MARPLRSQWRIRTSVRRRHRTWMRAMVFATLGWGTWWFAVLLHKLAPNFAPPVWAVYTIACSFAAIGAVLGFFTIRARLIWVLLAGVPLFANTSLLLVPVILDDEVRAFLGVPEQRVPPPS
ncbi:MAG: hypothetical protein GY711_32655 [bacterium]|nr:hypothetical protein [bacterium]